MENTTITFTDANFVKIDGNYFVFVKNRDKNNICKSCKAYSISEILDSVSGKNIDISISCNAVLNYEEAEPYNYKSKNGGNNE